MPNTRTTRRFDKLGEIVRLVEQFEDHSLPHGEWNHRAHLTVSLWYMLHYDEAEASSRMIDGIRAYNHAHGIRQTRCSGYHETITLFWLTITRRFVRQVSQHESKLDLVNEFLDRHEGQGALIFEYYSRERLFSWHARQCWLEPDLRPINGELR